jgi:hypothetical protein
MFATDVVSRPERLARNIKNNRAKGRFKRHLVAAVAIAFLLVGMATADDEVPVPGGPAAIRHLFRIEASDTTFFLDLHEVLLFEGNPKESWNHIERRKTVVSFVEDLAEWRREFGEPAAFSAVGKEPFRKVRLALEWIGFKVKGEGRAFTTVQRDDPQSLRRQSFLDMLGMPLTVFLKKLREGEIVSVASPDQTVPLPFGLAAWRETLREPRLSAGEAFLYFVKNVDASRMLVALHALDADTRDELRGLIRDEKGRNLGWRILYEKALDTFSRFPDALMIRDGRFVLPGGKEAEAIWTDILGTSPSDRPAFLTALYTTDLGKAAYVVDILQQLPDSIARELLLGRTGGGQKSVKRFRRLYKAIERSGESFVLNRRDAYDFGHLAPFLKLSDEGNLLLPAADLDSGDFPHNESELAEILSNGSKKSPPEETLRRLLRGAAADAAVRFPAQRRFLFVSSLIEGRPALQDPGLAVLLFRGLDRFLPAYAVLQDLPLDGPNLARRYIFTLDRLDRRGASRAAEVSAGLFQASVELLAQLSRAQALTARETQDLFAALLDQPLFAKLEIEAGHGERQLYQWLSERLLGTLKAAERRLIEARQREEFRREAIYREALMARDAQIIARLPGERAAEEERRAAAQANLRRYSEPRCVTDDRFVGPLAPRYRELEIELAGHFAAEPAAVESSEGEVPNPTPPSPEGLARVWVSDALAIEDWRSRPLPPPVPPRRAPGVIPGTSAIVDLTEPLPELIKVGIPEESPSSDELLTRALVGVAAPSLFEWRGGSYLFDPTTDDANRRREFREKQQLTRLEDLQAIQPRRDALVTSASKGDLAATKAAMSDLVTALGLLPGPARQDEQDERLRKEYVRAREAALEIAQWTKPKKLAGIGEYVAPLDAVIAERHLEALLGHIYAASIGDPTDLYYQDPEFVRRHAFHSTDSQGNLVERFFSPTELITGAAGRGSRVTGSVFGLPDVLGGLHADQLPHKAGVSIVNDDVRAGFVGTVRRMSAMLLDDDALEFVAASSRASEQLCAALAGLTSRERFRVWSDLARDLVPRSRLVLVSKVGPGSSPDALSQYLSPSDLYLIGRRIAMGRAPASVPPLAASVEAKNARERLRKKFGEEGARERLAQFGPRAVWYAGRFRLTDMDMPAYERLASYRTAQLLSDRLYDLKIAVACLVHDAALPAATLPLVLPGALDEMLAALTMSFAYDWSSTVRAARSFEKADLDRFLDQAVRTGRLVRDQSADRLAANP